MNYENISYLILPITTLSNNGYSFNNKQIQSNDITADYNLFGNNYGIVTKQNHCEFSNLTMKCYLNSSENCKCSVYVYKNLGYPESQLISIDTSNGIFSLPNNSSLIPSKNYKCGIIKFNNKYYCGFYQTKQNTYEWWYISTKYDGWTLLGTIAS